MNRKSIYPLERHYTIFVVSGVSQFQCNVVNLFTITLSERKSFTLWLCLYTHSIRISSKKKLFFLPLTKLQSFIMENTFSMGSRYIDFVALGIEKGLWHIRIYYVNILRFNRQHIFEGDKMPPRTFCNLTTKKCVYVYVELFNYIFNINQSL